MVLIWLALISGLLQASTLWQMATLQVIAETQPAYASPMLPSVTTAILIPLILWGITRKGRDRFQEILQTLLAITALGALLMGFYILGNYWELPFMRFLGMVEPVFRSFAFCAESLILYWLYCRYEKESFAYKLILFLMLSGIFTLVPASFLGNEPRFDSLLHGMFILGALLAACAVALPQAIKFTPESRDGKIRALNWVPLLLVIVGMGIVGAVLQMQTPELSVETLLKAPKAVALLFWVFPVTLIIALEHVERWHAIVGLVGVILCIGLLGAFPETTPWYLLLQQNFLFLALAGTLFFGMLVLLLTMLPPHQKYEYFAVSFLIFRKVGEWLPLPSQPIATPFDITFLISEILCVGVVIGCLWWIHERGQNA